MNEFLRIVSGCVSIRLNITPPPSPVFGEKYKAKRPNKRQRTEDLQATTTSTTTSATGNVQIIEADSQGKFVRLFNSGTKVIYYVLCISIVLVPKWMLI